MVNTSEQANSALKELHHWLKKQWPIKQALPTHQQKQLAQICQQIYQQHQHHDFHAPEENRLYSQPGFEENQFHTGFLCLGKNSTTPLHDHAGSFALSLLLSGTVNISIYQRVENSQDNLSRLVFKETQHLQAGNFTSLPANNTLIHKLSTTSQTACLLDIYYPQFSADQRHWYLPIESSNGEQLSCQRISEGKFSTQTV